MQKTDRIGDPLNRVDGFAKVTGRARYAAEYSPPGRVYGVLVTSTFAKGRILQIDTKKAASQPGVLSVMTHANRPEVPGWEKGAAKGDERVEGQPFRVFYNEEIYFNHQPIALVIANTLEQATCAAAFIKVLYHIEPHETNLQENLSKAIHPKRNKDHQRGDINAWRDTPVKIEATYHTAIQVHNPMEMHAATAYWERPDRLIVYNKTQTVITARNEIKTAFQLKEDNILVHSPYVGGAFGSSSRVWPQEMAAILGARKVGRPVTVMARREQVFNMVGYRPESVQKIAIGAHNDGTLVGIVHEGTGNTSSYEEFIERMIDPTLSMYACPNLMTNYMLVPLDLSTPAWTRGPGETSGSFALESAIDELSYALHMDPIELRLKNFADKDPDNGKPWSSNHLKECYQRGAERFGWAKRNPEPKSMYSGDWLLGMGMSAGIYKADRAPASASATLRKDGTLLIQTSVADVGPGSATILTQIAADTFHCPVEQVTLEWGDAQLPPAPGQYGSHTTASTGTAVYEATKALQQRLKELAINSSGSPFYKCNNDDLIAESGRLIRKNTNETLSYTDLLSQCGLAELKVIKESKANPEMEQFSGKSFSAHFVEVCVHSKTGAIKANRVVTAIDAGKIMNHKTAASQVYGAVTWGIGIALLEQGIIDHRYGRYVNNNLNDYHMPVHADIPSTDVIFIDQPDPFLDPLGAKGLGEIGLIGLTAAIANAVYHATGKRIRDLPITLDKLL